MMGLSRLVRRLKAASVLLPIGLVVGIAAAPAAEYELRFGSSNAVGTPSYDEVLVPFARAIEADSQGRIAIDVRPAGGYGPSTQLLQQVESGTIDAGMTLMGFYPGRFPRSEVIELPTLFDTAETASRTLWRLYEEGLVADDFAQLKVLGLYTSPPLGLLVADKTSTNLHDLRGMRVRVSGSTLGLALSRLGMIPLGLPSNLVSTALDKQWIDAFSTSFDTAKTTPTKPPLMLIDQAPTLIEAKLSTPSQMLIMNKNSYEKLPRDLQLIIERRGGLEFGLATGRKRDKTESAALRELAANPKFRVLSFSKEDRAEIDERIKPVFDDWVAGMNALGIDGAALLKRARELSKAGS